MFFSLLTELAKITANCPFEEAPILASTHIEICEEIEAQIAATRSDYHYNCDNICSQYQSF